MMSRLLLLLVGPVCFLACKGGPDYVSTVTVDLRVAIAADKLEAAKTTWRNRFMALGDADDVAVTSARVNADGSDAATLKVEVVSTRPCGAPAQELRDAIVDATLRSGDLAFYATTAEAAKALATELRQSHGELEGFDVSTFEFPSALRVHGLDLAELHGQERRKLGARLFRDPNQTDLLWVAERRPSLRGDAVATAEADLNARDLPVVQVTLNAGGREAFSALTGRMLKQHVLIVFEGKVMSAPRVMERIRGGMIELSIAGDDPKKMMAQARSSAARLAAGALDAEPRLDTVTVSCENRVP